MRPVGTRVSFFAAFLAAGLVVVSVVLVFGAPGVAAQAQGQAQAQNGSGAPSPPEVDTEIRFEDEVRVGEETTIRPVATVEETPVSAEVSVDLTMLIGGEVIETQSFEEQISNDTVIRREFKHTFESSGRKQVVFRGVLSAQGQQVSGTISDEVDVLAEEDSEDTDGGTDEGGNESETRDGETPERSGNREADDENGSEEGGSDEGDGEEETETEGGTESEQEADETETGSEGETEGDSTEVSQGSEDGPEAGGNGTEAPEKEYTDAENDEPNEDPEAPVQDSNEETVDGSTEAEGPGADNGEGLPGFTAAVALVALFSGALYARYG